MEATLSFDFTRQDSTTMNGAITRSGEFDYDGSIMVKDWENIKEVFSKTDHIPLYGSTKPDSHKESEPRMIGYAHNFTPKEETEQMMADVEFFDDIKDLSDLYEPNNLPVSIRFADDNKTNRGTQVITKVKHLAVSLNKNELDRCSSRGGSPCIISIKPDSVQGRSSSSVKGDLVKFKKKKTILMAKEKKKEAEVKDTDDTKDDAIDSKKTVTATPDNVGSQTHKVAQNTKNAKASFILDCQKNGTYPLSQCNEAWNVLNNQPASPIKPNEKSESSELNVKSKKKSEDMIALEEKMKIMEKVFSDFTDIIPTLSQVVNDRNAKDAEKAVVMKSDLIEAGFCKDMVGNIDDFNELNKFYTRVISNKALFNEPTPDEIRSSNTSRFLGKKRKTEKADFDDMLEQGKKDAMARFYTKNQSKVVV